MVAISRERAFDPEFLQEFEDGLFFDGPRARRKIINFAVLLLLATVIATYGVILNSDATVIGAMIVAPLMTPIMATTAALVLANSGRAVRAGLTVILGVAAVILFAALRNLVHSWRHHRVFDQRPDPIAHFARFGRFAGGPCIGGGGGLLPQPPGDIQLAVRRGDCYLFGAATMRRGDVVH